MGADDFGFDFDTGTQGKLINTKDGPIRVNEDYGRISLRADGAAINLTGSQARDKKSYSLVRKELEAAIKDKKTGNTQLLTIDLGSAQNPRLEIYYGQASGLRADVVLKNPTDISPLADEISQLDIEQLDPDSPGAVFLASVIERLSDAQLAQALTETKTAWKPEDITNLKLKLSEAAKRKQQTAEASSELPLRTAVGQRVEPNLDAMDERIEVEIRRREALAANTPENFNAVRRELTDLGVNFADASTIAESQHITNFNPKAGLKQYAVLDLNNPKHHKWLAERIDNTSDFWLFNSGFGEEINAFARDVRDVFRVYVTDQRVENQAAELRQVKQIYLNKDSQGRATPSIKGLTLEVRSEDERNRNFISANRRVILIMENPSAFKSSP